MDNLELQEYFTQGAMLAGQGRHAEAIKYYERAEKLDPMNEDVYLAKGIAYANLDELDAAKAQFEKALKVNRTSGLAWYHLGRIAILQGNSALGYEDYNKAIANGYDDAQVYYSIGLLNEEQGDREMAIRNYSKAIMRDALRPDIRVRKARLLLQGGNTDEALQTLDEMILTNPDVFEGYHLKFTILLQTGDYDRADAVLDDAIALFPKDPAFVLDRVNLRTDQGKLDEALALLTELEGREETDSDVRRKINMQRAQIFAAQENLDAAIAALEKAKTVADQAGVFDTDVVFLLTNCQLAKENFAAALEGVECLLEKAPDGYIKQTALYLKPFALKKLERMEEAIPLYKEAINTYRRQSLETPENLDAYLLRIMCLRDLEQYDKAMELANYIADLQPERPEPHVLRASILQAQGLEEEAKAESQLAERKMDRKQNGASR